MNGNDQQVAAFPIWFNPRPSTFRRIGKLLFLLLVCAYFGYCYASHPSFLNLDL